MDTKLLTGINLAASATIVVSGGPDRSQPDLIAVGRDQVTRYGKYDDETRNLTLALAAGDHLIKLELEESDWFAGEVPLAVTSEGAVRFVVNVPRQPGAETTETIAWDATTTVGKGDPKDPWPRPVMTDEVQLDGPSYRWHDAALRAAREQLPKAANVI